MKFYFLAIGGLTVLSGATYWLCRPKRDPHHVSPAWLVEDERRQWGVGLDQVSIRWPIRKVVNEAARFNTAKLRKRA